MHNCVARARGNIFNKAQFPDGKASVHVGTGGTGGTVVVVVMMIGSIGSIGRTGSIGSIGSGTAAAAAAAAGFPNGMGMGLVY